MKVVIIGAGLGGLSFGACAARDGHEVVLIDKNREPGGVLTLARQDGFSFEQGPLELTGLTLAGLVEAFAGVLARLNDPARREEASVHKTRRRFSPPRSRAGNGNRSPNRPEPAFPPRRSCRVPPWGCGTCRDSRWRSCRRSCSASRPPRRSRRHCRGGRRWAPGYRRCVPSTTASPRQWR